jgi:hypothetical protein
MQLFARPFPFEKQTSRFSIERNRDTGRRAEELQTQV